VTYRRDNHEFGGNVTVDGNLLVHGTAAFDLNHWMRAVFTATAGQTVFTLPSVAADAATYELTVNGVEYVRGTDYTVSGTTLTWLNPFALILGDRVAIAYQL